jgi:hypothetical protein
MQYLEGKLVLSDLFKNLRNEKNSFLYLFHENDFFNYLLFKEFIFLIVKFQKVIIEDINFKKSVIEKLLYLLKMFLYHFDKNDEFKIQNFDEIKDITPELIDIIEYIIIKLSCDKKILKKHIENMFIAEIY